MSLISDAPFEQPFFNYLNFTDHEKHIVDEIRKLSQVEWFKNNVGRFGKDYSVPFAKTLTKRGVAFTFNMINFEELLSKKT